MIMTPTVSIVTFVQSWSAPILKPYGIHLHQNHFLIIEMYIPLANNMEQKSFIWVWLLGNVSHFGSQTFLTGSYTYKQNPFISQIYQRVCRFLCLVVCLMNLFSQSAIVCLDTFCKCHFLCTLLQIQLRTNHQDKSENIFGHMLCLFCTFSCLCHVWKKQQPSNNLPKPV